MFSGFLCFLAYDYKVINCIYLIYVSGNWINVYIVRVANVAWPDVPPETGHVTCLTL